MAKPPPEQRRCPACRLRFCSTRQAWCNTCSRVARPCLTKQERDRLRYIVSTIAPGLYKSDKANRTVAAALVVAAGKHPAGPYRLHFGVMAFAWADAVNHYGYTDPHAESLYRKLMGHDRVTMSAAPWPTTPARL